MRKVCVNQQRGTNREERCRYDGASLSEKCEKGEGRRAGKDESSRRPIRCTTTVNVLMSSVWARNSLLLLSKLADPEEHGQVKDNVCGALMRICATYPNAVPVDKVYLGTYSCESDM